MNPIIDQNAILQATNISKKIDFHGEVLDILRNISLHLYPEETLAIVGASGSGKSTLLTLLAGLDHPSSGEVILFGKTLSTLNEDERALLRRDQIGFVFQNFQLIPQLTSLENVMLPLDLAGHPDARREAETMLARVNLSQRLTHYPRQLSGGEQQRVALARAFVIKPKILFVDEPTGNLDEQTGKQVVDLLFQMNKEHKTTLVLVTHDMVLADRCQRTLRLVAGQFDLKMVVNLTR